MADRFDPVPVAHATASAAAVSDLVTDLYGLLADGDCALLNRGLNDTYEVTTPAGERFVLRVWGRRARGPADVAAETAFLAHLAAPGVPVAAAVLRAPTPCSPRPTCRTAPVPPCCSTMRTAGGRTSTAGTTPACRA